MKHTKGPWIYDDIYGLILAESNGAEIAALHSGIEANAQLIAAAPDLFAALKYLSALVDNAPFELTPEQSNHLYLAQCAIAKAEGQDK